MPYTAPRRNAMNPGVDAFLARWKPGFMALGRRDWSEPGARVAYATSASFVASGPALGNRHDVALTRSGPGQSGIVAVGKAGRAPPRGRTAGRGSIPVVRYGYV